jgi:uncharacterized membrane protein
MRKLFSIVFSAALLLIGSAQLTWAQKVSNVRHYPGGTWAALWDLNDAGVAVGWGDVAGGDTRMIGVPLVGPNAGKWFESGVSSDEAWAADGGGISITGMIVGSVKDVNGEARAYAWTVGEQGGIDLGTLPGDVGSAAIAINNSGTLIVGGSYHYLSAESWWLTPVAWTPKVEWHNGQPVTTWVIHALPTGGLELPGAVFENVTLNLWGGWGVNDLGQIAGDGYTTNGIDWWEIAVVWNPTKNGKDWEIQRLPMSDDHPFTEALSINNRGEVVGDVWGADALPALWKMKSPGAPTWNLSELAALSGTREGWNVAWGINDVGDVVGVSNDARGHWLATRWLTSDPSTAKVLGFPGQWSQAMQVNNLRIAVGTYGSDGGPQQAVAVAIH